MNLSIAGRLDWVHWGLQSYSSMDRKANVTPQISDLTPIRGSNETNAGVYIFQVDDNLNTYSWSDGTPTLEVNRTVTGVWAYGFPTSIGTGFEITVPADTSLKTLKVYVGAYAARGRFEASLSDESAPHYLDTSVINIRSGPNTVYTLQFAADSPGQTLRIHYTASIIMDPTGNVTLLAAALTAEGANSPPTVSLATPASDANFPQASPITLTANAADLDGQVEKVEFFADAQKLGEDSANPYSFDWNAPGAGRHTLTAVAYDNSGNFALSTPVEIFVYGSGGMLVGAVTIPPPLDVDLTVEGMLDWTHWGTVSSNSFDRKAGVAERISNFVPIGPHQPDRYSDNHTRFSWTDGKPTSAVYQTPTGVFMRGDKNGFRLTVPADTFPKQLKVYVGLYAAAGAFRAYLSDMSAPAYSDASLTNIDDNDYAVYTLDYVAASAGQNLIIDYRSKILYDLNWGNVTLQSATLSGAADPNLIPDVSIIIPTNNTVFLVGTNIEIEALAGDPDGSVANVEFFRGNLSLGQDTLAPYSLIWTNPPPGSYTLTAKVTDDQGAIITSEPVQVDVRNPPPLEVRLENPRLEAGEFRFDIATESGRSYTLERSDTLAASGWQTWSSFPGDGTVKTISDSATGRQFYRARIQ